MPYAEMLSSVLSDRGFNVPLESIPEQSAVDADLARTQAWLNELEPLTRDALDATAAEQRLLSTLAAPDVGLAPALGPVLAALDAQEASLSISAAVATLAAASATAAEQLDDEPVA